MENFIIDYKFDLDDFKVMENIEQSYFIDGNITKAEEVLKWYEKNDLTCIGVRNSKNRVIASVSILPLNYETYDNIRENKINEADVIYSQIEQYQDNNSYYIYLSSISIDEDYRNNYRVIKTLLKGCINLFDLLLKKGILIKEVMADASTVHGEKICKNLLKMDYIRDTSHESKIYLVDGERFVSIIEKLNKYLNKRNIL